MQAAVIHMASSLGRNSPMQAETKLLLAALRFRFLAALHRQLWQLLLLLRLATPLVRLLMPQVESQVDQRRAEPSPILLRL